MEERRSQYKVDLTGQLETRFLNLKTGKLFTDKLPSETPVQTNPPKDLNTQYQLEKDLKYLIYGEVSGDLESSYSF